MVQQTLVAHFPLHERQVLFRQSFVFLLQLFEEDFEVFGLHEQNGPPDEFKQIDVFAEFGSHFVCNFERASALGLVLHLLIRNDLLAVPPKPGDHLLDLRRRLIEVLDMKLDLIFEFGPVGLIILANRHPVFADYPEQRLLLCVRPAFLVLLALGFVLEVDFALVLLDFYDCVY